MSYVIYALVAPLEEWGELPDEELEDAAREWLADAWSHLGAGRPAASIEGLYKLGTAWKRSVMTFVKAQFKAREEEKDPTEDDFLKHGSLQLARLAMALRS